MHRRILMTFAAATMLSACSGMKKKNQTSILDQSLRAYAGAVRWGNYDTAAAFAVPREGMPSVHPSTLGDVKVTGYSLRINSINDEANEASVIMNFSYYSESRGTVGTVIQDATWYYNSEKTGWLMDDSLPRFKI